MKFTYIGKDKDGQSVHETVEATDRFAVYEIARTAGNTVESITEQTSFSFSGLLNVQKLEYYMSHVGDDELVMITRNLGSMLRAGLTLARGLSVIERQSTNPKLKGIMEQVIATVNKGEPFNVALSKYPKVFSDLYVAMVKAGEESGGMADTLQALSIQMERASNLRKKIKGAMIYPAIVITILIIIGILMMVYVMPSITSTFQGLGAKLPTSTRILIGVSNFMVHNLILTIGGMIAAVVAFIAFLRSRTGHIVTSWLFPRLPVIGTMVKETNAARTSRTLASLLGSGVDVLQALSITKDVVQNVYYKEIIAEAARRVEKGTPLSEVFVQRSDLYPVLVGEMILVGEETGNISNMLKELAVFYETEVEQKTKDLSTIIEPLLMVVIGGVVGFFALSIIGPIYSIGNSIN